MANVLIMQLLWAVPLCVHPPWEPPKATCTSSQALLLGSPPILPAFVLGPALPAPRWESDPLFPPTTHTTH